MKRVSKKVILIVFIILCTTCATALASGIDITSLFLTAKSMGLRDAVFEREGEICYFDYSEGKIIIIDDEGGKYSPVLSPDKTKILYRRSVLETEGNTLQFGIIDLNGKSILDITIDSELSNDIIGCQWLSDTTVGITTHVNPSTSEFFVYDITNGEMTQHYIGYSFAQIPNTEKIIYAKNVPHWSDEHVYHSFVVDGKTVYTSDALDAKLYPPVFSGDLTKIAFVEELPNTNDGTETQRIITGDFDNGSITIKNIDKIDVPPEISGYLTFDSNNNVCVVNGNLLQTYDKKTESFNKKVITTDLRDSANDSKNFAELQKAVTEYWGDDSLDKINNINWTSEGTK